MKIRSGFVSNSSSSSFIIGYGIIKDKKAFQEYCNKHKLRYSESKEYDDCCVSDIFVIESASHLSKNLRIIEGGNDTELIMPNDYNHYYNNSILRVQIQNDEGDSAFSEYDYYTGDWVDLNYKKAEDIDFYCPEQQAVIRMFEEPFIKEGKVIYGAERNG